MALPEYDCYFAVRFCISARNLQEAKERAEEVMDALNMPEKGKRKFFPDEIEKDDLIVS